MLPYRASGRAPDRCHIQRPGTAAFNSSGSVVDVVPASFTASTVVPGAATVARGPISDLPNTSSRSSTTTGVEAGVSARSSTSAAGAVAAGTGASTTRSEERRVGKEGRNRRDPREHKRNREDWQ